MTRQIALEQYITVLVDFLDETFEQVHGIYLDRGTSLFETLATITAEEASRPVSVTCATLAAQVAHVDFYLNVIEGYLRGTPPENVDWGEIWRTVSAVTTDEWDTSKARLKASYDRIVALIKALGDTDGEIDLYDPLAVIVHTAYHLGEIRQALCTLRTE